MKFVPALIASLLPAFAWSFDFKGIAVGSPATPAQIEERLGVKCGTGVSSMQVCNGKVTVAREPATVNLVINAVGNVQRIDLHLSPNSFDVVAPELVAKFGPASSTTRGELQNRMGAKYEQTELLWRGEAGLQLQYSRYAGSLTQSRLYFSTAQDRELFARPKANRGGDI